MEKQGTYQLEDEKAIVPEKLRSQCGIAAALDLIGDRWTLLIIRDLMFHGRNTYQEIQNGPEQISTSTLAAKLKMLEEKGLIGKEMYQQNPVRHRYYLTSAGNRLRPVLLAIGKWADTEVEGIGRQPLFPQNDQDA
ncbi:helix-turn-helix transcriptional regulator [Kordiimonas sp. SCSIO 12603]|uniref:winged helix-turn-helix transcriptional regulator n=1 Tax=Kordiimonas sp. SCSIO 12603 TaxID=2829596 RepID=UPI00210589F5|nr:helix-turn-helix domain-containing protein [Kordiimonas sp. SCSIO 12603]UTW60133.1 helix-turn-helix transcriptional regulator [Kordiimonas sp. SCSIO 12603]